MSFASPKDVAILEKREYNVVEQLIGLGRDDARVRYSYPAEWGVAIRCTFSHCWLDLQSQQITLR